MYRKEYNDRWFNTPVCGVPMSEEDYNILAVLANQDRKDIITDKDRVEWWLKQTHCTIEYVDYCIKRDRNK
jgi:hypothetical protein